MRNLLQTQSIAWAQGVRVALEAEGVRAAILDEHDRGAMGALGRVRIVVLDDDDLAKAQAIVARLTPPRTGPPRSWRWQKRGLLMLGADFILGCVSLVLLDHYQSADMSPGVLFYLLTGLVGILFLTGILFIMLGPRADRAKGNP